MVVDASAALELLCRSPRSTRIAAAMTEHGAGLHVPAHFHLEIVNAVRRLVRVDSLTAGQADGIVDDLAAFPVLVHDAVPLLRRVWALRDNATAYDASYLALAEGLQAPLLTGDARLARASGHRAEVIVV